MLGVVYLEEVLAAAKRACLGRFASVVARCNINLVRWTHWRDGKATMGTRDAAWSEQFFPRNCRRSKPPSSNLNMEMKDLVQYSPPHEVRRVGVHIAADGDDARAVFFFHSAVSGLPCRTLLRISLPQALHLWRP